MTLAITTFFGILFQNSF